MDSNLTNDKLPIINADITNAYELSDFIIEDLDIKSLNGGIKKKFTSLATNATIFRWKFGDTNQNPIIETTENPYYYTFKEKGTYNVSHQSCYPCNLTLVCSPGWCTKAITVEPIKGNALPLLAMAGFFFILIPRKECEDFKSIKDCNLRDYCQWLPKENKCVKKCIKGYKINKVNKNKFECIKK